MHRESSSGRFTKAVRQLIAPSGTRGSTDVAFPRFLSVSSQGWPSSTTRIPHATRAEDDPAATEMGGREQRRTGNACRGAIRRAPILLNIRLDYHALRHQALQVNVQSLDQGRSQSKAHFCLLFVQLAAVGHSQLLPIYTRASRLPRCNPFLPPACATHPDCPPISAMPAPDDATLRKVRSDVKKMKYDQIRHLAKAIGRGVKANRSEEAMRTDILDKFEKGEVAADEMDRLIRDAKRVVPRKRKPRPPKDVMSMAETMGPSFSQIEPKPYIEPDLEERKQKCIQRMLSELETGLVLTGVCSSPDEEDRRELVELVDRVFHRRHVKNRPKLEEIEVERRPVSASSSQGKRKREEPEDVPRTEVDVKVEAGPSGRKGKKRSRVKVEESN